MKRGVTVARVRLLPETCRTCPTLGAAIIKTQLWVFESLNASTDAINDLCINV
jgi:hypothetical protein